MKSTIFYELADLTIVFAVYMREFFNKVLNAVFFIGLIYSIWFYADKYGSLPVSERLSYYENGSALQFFTLDDSRPYFAMQITTIILFLIKILHISLMLTVPRLRTFFLSLSDHPYLYALSLYHKSGTGVEYGYKPFTSIFELLEAMSIKDDVKIYKKINNLHRRLFRGKRRGKLLEKTIIEFKKVESSDMRYAESKYFIALILLRGLNSNDIISIRNNLEIAANHRVPNAKFELGLLLVSNDGIEDRKLALSLFDKAIKETSDKIIEFRARIESAKILKLLGSTADLTHALIHLNYIIESPREAITVKSPLSIFGLRDSNFNTDNFHVEAIKLRRDFQDLLDVNMRADAELNLQRARLEESRQMISFLSHTLTSATTGLTKTVRKIASNLANEHEGGNISAHAERLAVQVSRMSRVESLVEVFKLYTSEPSALRTGWSNDSCSGVTVLQVAAMAIQQALLRFYFSSEHETDFTRLMPEVKYSTAANEFTQDVLALDMTDPISATRFIEWMRLRLPFISFTYEGAESVQIGQGGARDIVIFALVSEFLGNALKYAASGELISLEIGVQSEFLEIAIRNVMHPAATPHIYSGKSGLTFVRHVCSLIDAKFEENVAQENIFTLRVLLPLKTA